MKFKTPRYRSPILTLTPERFWGNVDKSGECWLWTGARSKSGYGQLRVDGKSQYAHRLAWRLATGTDPGDAHVLHRCDQPACVRHEHHFLGAPADNAADKVSKGRQSHYGRQKTHCPKGHEYNAQNTYTC